LNAALVREGTRVEEGTEQGPAVAEVQRTRSPWQSGSPIE
jgi:hypothetical protein